MRDIFASYYDKPYYHFYMLITCSIDITVGSGDSLNSLHSGEGPITHLKTKILTIAKQFPMGVESRQQ